MLTFCGRALSLQGGASPEDLSESLMACVLCGACEPSCPVGIDTVGMTMDLRSMLIDLGASPMADRLKSREKHLSGQSPLPTKENVRLFLPGATLRTNAPIFRRVRRLLEQESNISIAADDGSDAAVAMEAGLQLTAERKRHFIRSLEGATELVVTEGILHRHLRRWLPGIRVTTLGEALLRQDGIRKTLGPTDLYLIETRGFHADYDRLVHVYDRLRRETGCALNLDLQRIAIPTGAACLQSDLGMNTLDPAEQVRWIIDGRHTERIVVESPEDLETFRQATQLRVIHISELKRQKHDH